MPSPREGGEKVPEGRMRGFVFWTARVHARISASRRTLSLFASL